MLTKEQILRSNEAYLLYDSLLFIDRSEEEDIYLVDKDLHWSMVDREVFKLQWGVDPLQYEYKTVGQALLIIEGWEKEIEENISKLNEAIIFATNKHANQYRKTTKIPYILHPLESLTILSELKASIPVMMAGVLHDTIEDTNTTKEELIDLFGEQVTSLVLFNSEDKTKSWKERKLHTIESLMEASHEEKLLVFSDKLANLRSIASDYKMQGDLLWTRFNASKNEQAWYYGEIVNALSDFELIDQTKELYEEFSNLYHEVFVKFYYDEEKEVLYELIGEGGIFLAKENIVWEEMDEELLKEMIDIISETNVVLVSKEQAESIEMTWNMEFLSNVDKEDKDGVYPLFKSKDKEVYIKIENNILTLYGNEEGTAYEYGLDKESTYLLFGQLRLTYGKDISILDMLKEEFGDEDGTFLFLQYLEQSGIRPSCNWE